VAFTRLIWTSVMIVLTLAGCGVASTMSSGVQGVASSIFESGEARRARLVTEDDAKCRQLGFKPGTEGYGNCRLQLEQIRATRASSVQAREPRRCGYNFIFC
jgi:hypothetical protein